MYNTTCNWAYIRKVF